MDFDSEPFVKIYTTETPTVRYWGFWGTVLMEQLVKKSNRAGVVALPFSTLNESGDYAPAIASVIGCGQGSVDWVREHLPPLLEHGSVRHVVGKDEEHYLVLTRYHEGQYGGIEPKASKKFSAQKIKDTDDAIENGLIDPPFWHRSIEKAV